MWRKQEKAGNPFPESHFSPRATGDIHSPAERQNDYIAWGCPTKKQQNHLTPTGLLMEGVITHGRTEFKPTQIKFP
jgi:hypothetical protein